MSERIQAVRGMNDILPEQTPYWQHLEKHLRDIAAAYGYREFRFPVVEKAALFKRTIGEETDIVSKEMYTFEDRSGEQLTLRPEGTAGCVRAGIEQGLLYNQIQRLWYLGPMFRYERPQKGRYRQFTQYGVETFGIPGSECDAEHILMMARLWRTLGIEEHVVLQLNSLGSSAARKAYRDNLVAYFKAFYDVLDEDSQRRLTTNPLRILDSKNPAMQEIIDRAPSITECLDDESRQHLDTLCELLDAAGVKYEINPRLVRGLDYYCSTVYEWVTEELGAQNAVCAGGRYDGLVEQLGGKDTPACGFAMGLDRIVLLLEKVHQPAPHVDVCVLAVGDEAVKTGMLLAEQCRDKSPEHPVALFAQGGLKSLMKKADKSGAQVALIVGEDEVKDNTVTVKYLRREVVQQTHAFADVVDVLKKEFSNDK